MVRRQTFGFNAMAIGAAMVLLSALTPLFAAVPSSRTAQELFEFPGNPKYVPALHSVALPEERATFIRLLQRMQAADPTDADAILAILNESLASLRQPTKLRGFVQMSRAEALTRLLRHDEAAEAVEESIRLLPRFSAPLLTAVSLYAYSDQPAKGADFLLRASQIDPDTVRALDDYEISNLLRRLAFIRDKRRVAAVSDRLIEIGWLGSSLSSRSGLVREAIIRRFDDGNIEGARSLVTKLLTPSDSYSLLVNRTYEPIWGDIEAWAGRRLERQWKIYLDEERSRWQAIRDATAALNYVNALRAAGHDDTIIKDILPLFSGDLDPIEHYQLIFVTVGVAKALASKERWADVDTLFERAQKVWPLGSEANALNIFSNRMKYRLIAEKPDEALAGLDASIQEGERWKVNPDAIATMHLYRACALHALGRTSEAEASKAMAMSLGPASNVYLHVCVDDYEAARKAVLEGLKSDGERQSVLSLLQIWSEPPTSNYERKHALAHDRLRSDAEVLRELEKYGRLLPFSLTDGAPKDPNRPLPR